jgi:predicted outer membrane repeat protein
MHECNRFCAVIGLLAVLAAAGGAALRVPADYETILDAMTAATSGDTVLVAPGLYPEQNIPLKSDVALISESGDPHNTIIDGQYFGRIFYGMVDLNVLIRGFTLRNGFSGYERGGCFYFYICSVTMESCIIQDCTAYNDGGGGFCSGGSGVLRDVEFLRNATQLGTHDGGGLHLENSGYIIEHAVFEDNSCEGSGGAIYCRNSNATEIRDARFTTNSSAQGGAIRCYDASPTLENVIFVGNLAVPGEGGAIFSGPNCQPRIEGATFIGNAAHRGGALMCRDNGNTEVENALVYDNHAVFEGGGVCAYSASPSLQGVTLCGNSADSSGGNVYCTNSSSWFTATLIAYATTGGGSGQHKLLSAPNVLGCLRKCRGRLHRCSRSNWSSGQHLGRPVVL